MIFSILVSTWFAAKSTRQIFTIYFQESDVTILLSSEVEEHTQILQSRFKIWLSVHTIFKANTFQYLSSVLKCQRKLYREEKLLVCATE